MENKTISQLEKSFSLMKKKIFWRNLVDIIFTISILTYILKEIFYYRTIYELNIDLVFMFLFLLVIYIIIRAFINKSIQEISLLIINIINDSDDTYDNLFSLIEKDHPEFLQATTYLKKHIEDTK